MMMITHPWRCKEREGRLFSAFVNVPSHDDDRTVSIIAGNIM